ncbi:HpcH/HpaI aldolase/citrate lyase family protein [Noviherbaspirillum sedimenti]|uniref:CoA ester lyase n=1 Tax=Noviherbaspirillum sedimenti TaxID=2320865 RepID=A0A3A3G6K6_9BURK|nr:CoA ester lyase [Noviherbaspirillum sedimenti]RJG03285.1 CoA ester lyase [Noviherbaspirillum sedimenti]
MKTPIRSFLFVPADSEKKIGKAMQSSADALVLDLEDSVMPARKKIAREAMAELLASPPAEYRGELWVRINPLTMEYALDDLCAVVAPTLAGILLPKTTGPRDVETASNYISAIAAKTGLTNDEIGILAVSTETAAAPFALGDYHKATLPRLWGLTWGAEDLSSAIGAATNKGPDGDWAFTYRMVRSQCLLAAKACGVQCIETLYADFRNSEGLRASCIEALREGFTGRFAIHPSQVDVINEAFMPSPADVEHARRVIAAFDAAGDSGTVGLDGQMLDIPHLNQARKVLALHAAFGGAA